MKNKVFILFTILFLTANAGYCAARNAPMNDIIVKFILVMAGVVISSIIIFIGLTIYNKIISEKNSSLPYDEDVFKSPKSTNEAIQFFINKNRLR